MLSCTTYIIRKRLQKYTFFFIQQKKLFETAPQEWLSLAEPCRFRGRGLTEILLDNAYLFG